MTEGVELRVHFAKLKVFYFNRFVLAGSKKDIKEELVEMAEM
jgi:hypothetical protein